VLSFYFEPDLSAGSFRATALVDALKEKMPIGAQIDVLSTSPNRYSTFVVEAFSEEKSSGLHILRIGVPTTHQSGMFAQAKGFFFFARGVLEQTRGVHYDLVFASSSRLMTAVLGAWLARRKQVKLYLDIRDIFADTVKDVLPWYLAILAKPVFSPLENWAVKKANTVNLVSKGFTEYFLKRYPNQRFSYFTNGIDDEFLHLSKCTFSRDPRKVLEVLYAGNLGEGQGLHAIIPYIAKRMNKRLCFKVIGDGGRKEALKLSLSKLGVVNVEILPPMKRAQLILAYQKADVLFLHLNDRQAFEKVLPSKLFEYGATGKPIWAGVSGYARKFIKENISNAAIFSPCNVNEAVDSFMALKIETQPRNAFVKKFSRAKIMKSMAKDIVDLAEVKN
jgi:hypothetical protein